MTTALHDTQQPTADTVLLLALCPAIAVSDTVVNAIGLGVATCIAAVVTSCVTAMLSRWWGAELRLTATMFILAGVIAAVELIMRAFLHELHSSLGVFLALAVSNFAIVQRLQDQHSSAWRSISEIAKLSAVVLVVLAILGVGRELVGRGSLLHGAGAMLGSWAAGLELVVFRVDMGFLLAMLPPGAFISLGLLIAAHNWFAQVRTRTAHE